MAELSRNNFWTGVGIGTIVIIIINLILPFFGSLIGGFVAGYLAKADVLNAGRAGLYAGVLAAIVVSVILYAELVGLPGAAYLAPVGSGFLLYISITVVFAFLGFLGGAISGMVRK